MTRPLNAADSAAVWWRNKGLGDQTWALLDRTQFDAAMRILNTGDLDAQERWEVYQRALAAFGVPQ